MTGVMKTEEVSEGVRVFDSISGAEIGVIEGRQARSERDKGTSVSRIPPEHPYGSADDSPDPPALLQDPQLLQRIGKVITERGYAGDVTPALVVYVAIATRCLGKPMCVAVVAPSSAGKNRVVEAAAELVPKEALIQIDAASDKALIYGNDDLRHRVIIFGEADSIPDEGAGASAIRALISNGRLSYQTVEKSPEGSFSTRVIDREGPTGLITTSTKSLADQIGTRVLEIHLRDDQEQTRQILKAQARAKLGLPTARPDPSEFVAAQKWLESHGTRDVVIPYAEALADLCPARDVRMRRDFQQLLTAIEGVAFLHQCQRERTADGKIVASLDDYAMARQMLAPVYDAQAADGLTPAIRETVEAVAAEGDLSGVGLTTLCERLGLGKSAMSARVQKACAKGWLVNHERTQGREARIVLGEPLPDAVSSLPLVAEVAALATSESEPFLDTISGTPHTATVEGAR